MDGSLTVLLVDDSLTSRALLQRILSLQGHQVVVAEDGDVALERLRHDSTIEVILCDINMPRLSGVDFLEQAASVRDLQEMPVFMITADTDPADRQQLRERGAAGLFVKPVLADKLQRALQRVARERAERVEAASA